MTYRFHQLINATLSPKKALEVNEPSQAMLGGVWMEAAVALKLGFQPWLPDTLPFDQAEVDRYAIPAGRVVDVLAEEPYAGLVYQPALVWPSVESAEAEGHPDFIEWVDDHIIDLKTTEYPTEEMLDKLLHSVQMVCYMAAYRRQYERVPKLSILLASRLDEPHPVMFNKNGTVALSGQKACHDALRSAVELMGEQADDRHWKLVYSAPTWNPLLIGSLDKDECEHLAKVGEIFLDAGLAILNTGLADSVCRPYT
jgi:hypothetical protein